MAAPDTIQVFVPLKMRKKNGRPTALPLMDESRGIPEVCVF